METDVIEILKELIKIDSRNPFKIKAANSKNGKAWKSKSDGSHLYIEGNETVIAEFLEKKLVEAGFSVGRQVVHYGANGTVFYNLLAEKGNGDKSILFYGHMDTVSDETWLSTDKALTPTQLTEEISGEKKEVIVGLGSYDMKAGLAVILSAFTDFSPTGHKIKVAFGVDEEFYSLGANLLAESSFFDDVLAIVVPEIGDGPNLCYGPETIMLGRLGRCEFVFEVYGTAGHGAESKNPKFINAATECAKIIMEIDKRRMEYKDLFHFSQEKGVDNELKNYVEGSFYVNRVEAGEGTFSIPSRGKIIVDYTFTPNYTSIEEAKEKGLRLLKNLIDEMYERGQLEKVFISDEFHKVRVEHRNRPTDPSGAYITPESHLFTKFITRIINEKFSFKNFNMGYSVADENVFSRIRGDIPILCIGPIGKKSHEANEWVEIDSVRRLQKLYLEIGRRFPEYLKRYTK